MCKRMQRKDADHGEYIIHTYFQSMRFLLLAIRFVKLAAMMMMIGSRW